MGTIFVFDQILIDDTNLTIPENFWLFKQNTWKKQRISMSWDESIIWRTLAFFLTLAIKKIKLVWFGLVWFGLVL